MRSVSSAVADALIVGAVIVCCSGDRAAQQPGAVEGVLVGAGDIASCGNDHDEATARLLDQMGGTVFTAGDNVNGAGTPRQYRDCYEPTWGRHKGRTRPSPGNHDYSASHASGYVGYFGAAAGPGYYSYELGGWHVMSLNSDIPAGPDSAQYRVAPKRSRLEQGGVLGCLLASSGLQLRKPWQRSAHAGHLAAALRPRRGRRHQRA